MKSNDQFKVLLQNKARQSKTARQSYGRPEKQIMAHKDHKNHLESIYLQIELDDGKVQRLIPGINDNAKQLATKFCMKYQLDDEMLSVLTENIQKTIDKLKVKTKRVEQYNQEHCQMNKLKEQNNSQRKNTKIHRNNEFTSCLSIKQQEIYKSSQKKQNFQQVIESSNSTRQILKSIQNNHLLNFQQYSSTKSNLYQRWKQKQQSKKQWIQNQRKRKQLQEVQDCTYSPSINKISKQICIKKSFQNSNNSKDKKNKMFLQINHSSKSKRNQSNKVQKNSRYSSIRTEPTEWSQVFEQIDKNVGRREDTQNQEDAVFKKQFKLVNANENKKSHKLNFNQGSHLYSNGNRNNKIFQEQISKKLQKVQEKPFKAGKVNMEPNIRTQSIKSNSSLNKKYSQNRTHNKNYNKIQRYPTQPTHQTKDSLFFRQSYNSYNQDQLNIKFHRHISDSKHKFRKNSNVQKESLFLKPSQYKNFSFIEQKNPLKIRQHHRKQVISDRSPNLGQKGCAANYSSLKSINKSDKSDIPKHQIRQPLNHNDYLQPKHQKHHNQITQKLYQNKKIKAFYAIFSILDDDGDGIISIVNINLINNIQQRLIKILLPILEQLEILEVQLNFQQFVDAIDNLFKELSLDQKDYLLGIKIRQEKDNNQQILKRQTTQLKNKSVKYSLKQNKKRSNSNNQVQSLISPNKNNNFMNISSKKNLQTNKMEKGTNQSSRNHFSVYQYSKLRQELKQQNLERQRILKQRKLMNQCTFYPKINRKRVIYF